MLRFPVRIHSTGTGSIATEPVSTGKGTAPAFVPLGELVDFELGPGPNQISRENGKRRVVITANVRGRDLGSFVMEAQEKVREVELTSGTWITWGGTSCRLCIRY